MHVARGIEEVDATEARPQHRRQTLGKAVDRQAGSVRGDDRRRRNEGCDPAIEFILPLPPFRDRFDDQVAIPQLLQMLPVVGGVDVSDTILARQRRRLESPEPVDGLADNSAGIACGCRQIEKDHRHFGIREVRGDLRAHDARSEYGGLAYDEVAQAVLLFWVDCVRRECPALALHQACKTNV